MPSKRIIAKAQPTASDVHVDVPLTDISIAYMQDLKGFVARKVFPELQVANQGNKYYKFDRENFFRTEARKRAPGTESAGSGFKVSKDSYFCDVTALHKDVPDQIRSNADSVFDLNKSASEFVTRDLLLEQEIDWASKYFSGGVWTGSTTGGDITPATKWSAAGSTPIEEIDEQLTAAHRKSGYWPNTIVMGRQVWTALKNHADFLERIKYTVQGSVVTSDLLSGVLGVERIFVADALYNAANEGAPEVSEYAFGKNLLACYAAPRPSLMEASAGYTFTWSGYLGMNEAGIRMKNFRMEPLASDRIEGESAYDHKVVGETLGVFMSDVVA